MEGNNKKKYDNKYLLERQLEMIKLFQTAGSYGKHSYKKDGICHFFCFYHFVVFASKNPLVAPPFAAPLFMRGRAHGAKVRGWEKRFFGSYVYISEAIDLL